MFMFPSYLLERMEPIYNSCFNVFANSISCAISGPVSIGYFSPGYELQGLSTVVGGNMNYYQSCVLGNFLAYFFPTSISRSQVAFTYAWRRSLAKDMGISLLGSPELQLSFSAAPSSAVLCPRNDSHLGLLDLPSLSQLHVTTRLYLGYCFLYYNLKVTSMH